MTKIEADILKHFKQDKIHFLLDRARELNSKCKFTAIAYFHDSKSIIAVYDNLIHRFIELRYQQYDNYLEETNIKTIKLI